MANNCAFDIHVRGTRESVDEFVKIITCNHPTLNFARIFSADVYYETQGDDGEVIAYICGECAWSVQVCMTDCGWSYMRGTPREQRCTLRNVSKWYNLDIEVWSEEAGAGFQEHFRFDNDQILEYICYDDFVEVQYDEREHGSFEEFAKEIGHPEITMDDLDDGYYTFKHDPVFAF